VRVLFDIVHPAQVHFFKNAIAALRARGDAVLVTAREKDVALDLLTALGIDHVAISRKGSGLVGMAFELLGRDFRLWKLARRFRPDVMVARVGMSIGPVGALLRVPRIVYDDMEHARLQAAISFPFATYLCTGLGYYRDLGKRQVRFRGSPVLAYLAPDRFRPDSKPLLKAGLDPKKPYIFIRTVSWGATHDVGRQGIGTARLVETVRQLAVHGRVVISSEDPLPEPLIAYRNPVPVQHMHDLLAFAKLCLVEGGTMAAEAAVLGVPTVCLKSYDFGYLRALEAGYGLIVRSEDAGAALAAALGLLGRRNLAREWAAKRRKMLAESDDVAGFMVAMVDRAVREHRKRLLP
jgi:predicted glycosyltransferase